MKPIRNFFNKLNAERRFNEAGPGHRLDESTRQGNAAHVQPGSSNSAHHQLSEEARQAGAAALARIEKQQNPINWSTQAIKAQAKKELERENAIKATPALAPKNEDLPQSNSSLTVSGVYFKCPLIGPEILPKQEMKEKIEKFVCEQYEEEKGLTSCLIIHTLNNNKEKVRIGVETLSRYLTNILDNPDEEKFYKIRLKNKVFQDRIVDLKGAFEFLTAAGFTQQVIDHEEYFVFLNKNDEGFENLQMLKEALLSAEPILPCLDRNLRVLRPAQAAVQINLPDDFFHLSPDEIKREQEAKTETVELMTQLRTKAMRDRDQIKEYHMYKYTLIRIRFPDGIVLQGTFYVHEKLSAVKEFVCENLNDPYKTFHLLLSGGSKLTDDTLSLLELKLVPAALLNLSWQDNSSEPSTSCLKPETIVLLADI